MSQEKRFVYILNGVSMDRDHRDRTMRSASDVGCSERVDQVLKLGGLNR
jgi:hypothetical protein